MTFSTRIAASARAMVTRYGREMTITRRSGDTYNPTTGAVTTTDTSTTVTGVLSNYSNMEVGDLILIGDRKITISGDALDEAPQPGDQVTVGTEVLDVVTVKSRHVNDSVITYELQVRK